MSDNTWAVSEAAVIDVPGEVRTLEVSLVRGRVDVVAGEGPARVEVHDVIGRPLEVAVQDGRLKVGYRNVALSGFLDKLKSFGSDESADVQITVPADVALSFSVVKADGLVAGLRGDAKVSTVSGPVVVDQCTGTLKASTVSGALVVRDHTGTVAASTVSGTLTVSGDVPDIKASTVSGDLMIDLTAAPKSAKISGVSGDVVLRAPGAGDLRLKLSAASGRVTVDGVEHSDAHHKGVVLGTGRSDVGTATISTVAGDLTVLTRDDLVSGSSDDAASGDA